MFVKILPYVAGLQPSNLGKVKARPVLVADFDVQLFEKEKICLLKERYDPEHPKVSLTNSIETAIVVTCIRHNLCPALWTFVEYSNMGNRKNSYQEYDMVVLEEDVYTGNTSGITTIPKRKNPTRMN